jgi:hypothetical protein
MHNIILYLLSWGAVGRLPPLFYSVGADTIQEGALSNSIELSGIFSEGYGVVPKKLMKAKDLKASTKLLLCYLLSYTGAGMECFPPINQITSDTGISKRTVISCINEAIKNGYLAKTQKQRGRGIGKMNIYTLLFMTDFTGAKNARANIASAKGSVASAKSDTLQVQNSTSNNNMNNNTKNNNTTRFSIPSSLDACKEFAPTWETWLTYRKELRKKVTPTMAAAQLSKLEKAGPQTAIAMIKQSIENGWQGLFPLKEQGSAGVPKQMAILEKIQERENAKSRA